MFDDGPKKFGKYIKKDSKVASMIKLSDYSFERISAYPQVQSDNPKRTIIHSKYHDPAELERSVKIPAKLEEVLVDKSKPRLPIIPPGDFTKDWLMERMSSKRRTFGFEDEDDFDLPIEDSSALEQVLAPLITASSSGEKTSAVNSTVLKKEEAAQVRTVSLQDFSQESPQVEMTAENLAKHANLLHAKETAQSSSDQSQSAAKKHPVAESSKGAFIPLQEKPEASNSEVTSVQSPEDKAMQTYKAKEDLLKQNEDILEGLKQQSMSEGFSEGYRLGEEKGLLAGQLQATEVFSRVSELLGEFEGLKKLILNNTQKNFFELCHAVAESLLEREFSIKPESFAKVLQRVIHETVTGDEFTIKLHPETWQKVVGLGLDDLSKHLVKDPAMPLGEFKIESQMTVVDGNVKKIVTQLLQNVDMELFEDSNKVAS